MRCALLALVLAVPAATIAQPTATFADGLLTITGTEGDDFLTVACAAGTAQLDGTDIPDVACADVERIDLDLGGGLNNARLSTLADFALDPANPGEYRGSEGFDALELDLSGHTGDLEFSIRAPSASGRAVTARAGHRSEIHVTREGDIETEVYAVLVHDGDRFVTTFVSGPGDDAVEIDPAFTERPLEGLTVFGGAGDDTLDLSGLPLSLGLGLEVTFNGQEGDDRFFAPPSGATIGWGPGGGTDVFTPGQGPDQVTIFGSVAALTIHEIAGQIGPGCSFYDFGGGGGVVLEGTERVDAARYFMTAPQGGDVYVEAECSGVERDLRWGNGGPDWLRFRGQEGGGTLVDIDFTAGQMSVFSDGFESRDLSRWSSTVPRGPGDTASYVAAVLWDGIDYQDWPSFADPATSGPSTVLVAGQPAFSVTLDLGPDTGTGGGATSGGAVDTLWVDPLGLPFTDDGSQIVIDGGPPITYTGADAVVVGARPTAGDGGPAARAVELTVAPNPLGPDGLVRLEGAPPGTARVTVFDLLGREVAVLHDGPPGADARWAFPAGRLATGVYLVRAQGQGWAVTRVVAVSH